MTKLTASLEDYLEVICNLSEENNIIRAVDVSKKLNVSRASATEALKKLVNKGFITYERHEKISLTEIGKDIAQNIVSKHSVLEIFFEEILNLSKQEASENACKIEHVITDNAFSAICNLVENREKQ